MLVHICLTRSGPGQRRKELDGDSGDHKVLQFIIYCFFDAKPVDLGANKKLLFDRPEDFEGTIIQNFHPYFDELKPFMREWFSLLVLAYQYIEGYEYHDIHRRVLDILDRALALMPLEKSDSDEGREAVFEERRDSLYALTKNLEKVGGDTEIVQGFDSTSPRAQRHGKAKLYNQSTDGRLPSPPSPSPSPLPLPLEPARKRSRHAL